MWLSLMPREMTAETLAVRRREAAGQLDCAVVREGNEPTIQGYIQMRSQEKAIERIESLGIGRYLPRPEMGCTQQSNITASRYRAPPPLGKEVVAKPSLSAPR